MSTKERLIKAIEALPEKLTIEEAVERLYRAFKLKYGTSAASPDSRLQPLPTLEGRVPEGWKDAIYE
jgi:hypothetical protein